MALKKDNKNSLMISIFINIILAVALIIAFVFGLFDFEKKDTSEPEPIIVDGYSVMEHAADFGVSIEFLQKIMPEYLVYSVAGAYEFQKINPDIGLHNYNFDNLYYPENGRIYYDDANYANVYQGIDVSYYQGEIDWQAVAADGIDFALIRVGFRGYGEEGKLVADETCQNNIEGALAAGLEVGAYFFSQAISVEEAEEEAQMLIDAVKNYQIDYPLIFDMEEIAASDARTANLDKETLTAIAKAFCQKIEQAGYTAMIYGNTKWLAGKVDLLQMDDYPLWFAQYYNKPLFPYDFDIWQYTNEGTVAGINGAVDLNICFQKSWVKN